MSRWWSACLAVVFFALAGCGYLSCETPIERERRELQEATESSDSLLYRGIKVALRSVPLREEAAAPDASSSKIRKLTLSILHGAGKSGGPEGGGLQAAEYVVLAKELYELRSELRDVDEDAYPTLLEQIATATGSADAPDVKAIVDWYGPDWEHLVLAMVWTASHKAPLGFVLYELSALDPSRVKLDPVRVASRLVRGVVYLQHQWPHLSEEETTAYLTDLTEHRASIVAFTRGFVELAPDTSDDQVYARWHAPGVLLRGVARTKQGDDEDAALDDLDAFLVDAQTLGLDDEGVWAIDAYVALRREDTDRALASLRKLQASDRLGDDEKQVVSEAIAALEGRDEDAALASLTDKAAMVTLAGGYVLRVLGKLDWRGRLEQTEAGRGLLRLDGAISGEIARTKDALSADQLRELGNEAAKSARQLGADATKRATELWHRAVE